MQVRREERTFQVNMSVEWCVLGLLYHYNIPGYVSNGFRIVYATYINSTQGFIQDFQFGGGGGRCCVWVNWDERVLFPSRPEWC